MLKQLYNCGNHGFHHVYMLLIILLIFSQDTCFNKSVHDIVSTVVIPGYIHLLWVMCFTVMWKKSGLLSHLTRYQPRV